MSGHAVEYSMTVKLLTEHDLEILSEHDLEFLSLKGGCTGSYEPTLVKMPHCKSHVMRGSRNFVRGGGGPGQTDKKALTMCFLCFV